MSRDERFTERVVDTITDLEDQGFEPQTRPILYRVIELYDLYKDPPTRRDIQRALNELERLGIVYRRGSGPKTTWHLG